MQEKPRFWDYITTDDDGFMNGIRSDAPEDIKKEYDDFIKRENENKIKGIKD